jgi:putative PIN family toxin of toxin-antitoxin system
MKVLLDTNVLASAAATRGLCADVLREVLANHELVLSGQILTELRRTLRDKFGVPRELIKDFVSLIQGDTICCEPGDLPDLDLKDKDDLGILAAAVRGAVHVVVTGDGELQEVGHVSGIKIMSPRQFWEELTAQPAPGGDA